MSELSESRCRFINFDSSYLFATDPTSFKILFTVPAEEKTPYTLKADIPKQLVSLVNNGVREIFVICNLNRVVVFTEDRKFIRSFSVLKTSLEIEDDDVDVDNTNTNNNTDGKFKPIPEEYDAIALNLNPTSTGLSGPEVFVGGQRSFVRVYDIYGKFLRKFRINESRGSGHVNRLNLFPHSRELAISDCFSNEIRIYGFEGDLNRRIQCDKINCPFDVVCVPNGNYLVANMLANNVLVFGPDGTFLRSFGEDFMKEPSAMALHKNNLIVVCNDIVHILDSSYWSQ